MSNNRDTQFSDFAEALWAELETAIQRNPGFIPEGEKRRETFLPMVQQIIARRAYDLATHIVEHYNSTHNLTTVPFLKDTLIRSIPDLPALPQAD